jgi:hypothetical protein
MVATTVQEQLAIEDRLTPLDTKLELEGDSREETISNQTGPGNGKPYGLT